MHFHQPTHCDFQNTRPTCEMRLNSHLSTIMKACARCGLAMNDDSGFGASRGTISEKDT